jgi:hypothetical protein
MKQESPPLIHCADEMRRLYWSGYGKKLIVIGLIWIGFMAMGWAIGAQWPQGIAFVIIITTIVIPHILRIHRGYTGQTCPSCGQAVGSYDSRIGRIHLVCRHCGTRTPTDCAIGWAGGPPYKVE